jgi:hypothetical protein
MTPAHKKGVLIFDPDKIEASSVTGRKFETLSITRPSVENSYDRVKGRNSRFFELEREGKLSCAFRRRRNFNAKQ